MYKNICSRGELVLFSILIVVLGLLFMYTPAYADGSPTFEWYFVDSYTGQKSETVTTGEYAILNGYLISDDVKYIAVKGYENCFYSKPKTREQKFRDVNIRIFKPLEGRNELVVYTGGPYMKDWQTATKLKMPFGVMIVTRDIEKNGGFFTKDKIIRGLQYKIFVANMKLGYMDTKTTLLSYTDKDALLYKYLEIYNADKSVSKMELYEKLQESNNSEYDKSLLNDIDKYIEHEKVNNSYWSENQDAYKYLRESLPEIYREVQYIDKMTMVELKARIKKIKEAPAVMKFDPSDWAKESVEAMLAANMSDETFMANLKRNLTREEMAMLCMKMWGKATKSTVLTSTNTTKFTDIDTSPYNGYIVKASEIGIVKGVNGTTYAPKSYLTRQEMCVMLYNTLKLVEMRDGYEVTDFVHITDEDDISPWALAQVRYMKHIGILKGTSYAIVEPKATITAEQTLTMIYRLCLDRGYLIK